MQPTFARTIGIDYSSAQTPTASLAGLRVTLAEGDGLPVEVRPPPGARKYLSRKGIAEWLVERLSEDVATLVGIATADSSARGWMPQTSFEGISRIRDAR